jgi:peptide/nickel transport system substrate-binding protein
MLGTSSIRRREPMFEPELHCEKDGYLGGTVKKLILFVVLLFAVGTVVASCGTETDSSSTDTSSGTDVSATDADTPQYGGTLRIVRNSVNPTFGWPFDIAGQSDGLSQVCLETLVRTDADGEIYPWLAESYKLADDSMSITFTLRQGVTFHDGSEFNAEVVKWNFEQYIAAGSKPLWDSVEVIDAYTIKVNFKKWDCTLLASFGDCDMAPFIISKVAYDTNGQDWVKANPVGTGPFVFKSLTLDSNCTFVKNTNYWKKADNGDQLPYLDGVEYVFAADDTAKSNTMLSDEADLLSGTLGPLAKDLEEAGFEVSLSINTNLVLVPDTANSDSPWSKAAVREAVEYAIDREALATAYGYGYLKGDYQLPPRGSAAYSENFALARQYDVEKAKTLLSEAGYPNGFETTIIGSPIADPNVLVAVQGYLQAVGIKAEVKTTQSGEWVSYMVGGTWENAVLAAPVPMVDATYMGGLSWIVSILGSSWARPAALTEAVEAASGAPSIDISKVQAATDIITQDALVIPVLESGSTWIYKTNVHIEFSKRASPSAWNPEDAWISTSN